MAVPQGLQPSVKMYVAALTLAGAGCAWWAAQEPVALPGGIFALTLALAFLTALRTVRIPALRSSFTASDAFVFFTLAAGGTLAALLAALASLAGATLREARATHPARLLFNASALAVSTAMAGAAFRGLGAAAGGPLEELLVPLMLAVAVFFLVNTAAVAGVVALRSGTPWARTWLGHFGWTVTSFASAFALAVALVAAASAGWFWLAVLGLPPAALFAAAYERRAAQLRAQPEAAAQETP